jgi:hypothetical protein
MAKHAVFDWQSNSLTVFKNYAKSVVALALKLRYLFSVFQNRRKVKETVQGWMDYIKIQKAVEVSTNVKMVL